MKNGIVRIKDIALKAKVSIGTVDRVIHNRGKVAEEVRDRILRIIREVGYEPNMMARALGTHKTFSIAALIPDPRVDSYWQAPKSGIEKAEKELRQFGMSVKQYLFDPHDEDSFAQKAQQLTASKPAGIIVAPIFYRQAIKFFRKWHAQHIPFVLFNTQIKEFNPLGYIGQDSYQSGMLAARLFHFGTAAPCSLLIAHVDEELSNASHLEKKEQGFKEYFAKKKGYRLVRCELDRSNMTAFRKKLGSMIRSTPDLKGIFVTTSKAFEIARYLETKKIGGIRLIGFDLLPENAEYLEKELIHFLINQHPKGQGYSCLHQLADHLIFKKPVMSLKYLPLDVVTKENAAYYADEEDRAGAEKKKKKTEN